MPDDLMRYDQLAQHALKGVVREALRIVERTGLPGEHHFYIAFNTTHPGVNIGERMMARYPREMTIVLQHQFWGLTVTEDRFEVELSFDNIPEKLIVPFDAVKGFLDPAVQFGLQFETVTTPPATAVTDKPKAKTGKAAKAEPAGEKPESEPKGDMPKVVSLDSFRKK
ncbi:MAG: SspB family protein [Aestuariivirga sp.]